jgi:hypothetical protein
LQKIPAAAKKNIDKKSVLIYIDGSGTLCGASAKQSLAAQIPPETPQNAANPGRRAQ